MGHRAGFAASLRRWAHFATALLVLLVAAPVALGSAAGPLARALGAEQEHVCKCGMERGQCGCPTCAARERARLEVGAPDPVATLENPCNQPARAIPFAALPSGVVPAAAAIVPAPRSDRVARGGTTASALRHDLEPPTPPPRIAAA